MKNTERVRGRKKKTRRKETAMDKKERKREEWVNSLGGLKLKQLNDPIISTNPAF